MLDKLRKTVLIKRPILFDLDNTVSGRAPIEKKNQQKKKIHCRSQVRDISLDFRDEKRL